MKPRNIREKGRNFPTFKARVFHVFIVDGNNELWYDDSLFAG
jgi:hypothetical protein